jgi:hypothetical protein
MVFESIYTGLNDAAMDPDAIESSFVLSATPEIFEHQDTASVLADELAFTFSGFT